MSNHYFVRKPKSELNLGILRTHIRGRLFEFITASGVFSRSRIDPGTHLLIESMILPEKGSVLDVGCGYGPVGIAAAVFYPNLHVVMTDVNQRAVWLAKENSYRNAVQNLEVKQGFLYEPLRQMRFETILSNPPITAGMKVVDALITEAPKHLIDDGLLQIVVRSKIGGKRLAKAMNRIFGNVEVLSRKGGYRVLLSKKLKNKASSII